MPDHLSVSIGNNNQDDVWFSHSLCMMDVTHFHHNADPLTELSCKWGVALPLSWKNPTHTFSDIFNEMPIQYLNKMK